MICGPKYGSVQSQTKQSLRPNVKAMEEPHLETESEQRSREENKRTGQIIDRNRRQKSMQ